MEERRGEVRRGGLCFSSDFIGDLSRNTIYELFLDLTLYSIRCAVVAAVSIINRQ